MKALFADLERVRAVTAEDVQRVARTYFTRKNRTVGHLVRPEPAEPPAGDAVGQ